MARTPQILDARGRPIQRKALHEEIARPTLTGIRQAWRAENVASNLTPGRLAAMLNDAANNSARDYLALAEEMEERDPHYAAVLGTRKRAISGLELSVEAASEDTAHEAHAGEIEALIRRPAFREMIDDALDAIGKGYSAIEILWQTQGRRWLPAYAHRDAAFFQFDRETGRELRLIEAANHEGAELPPYKFIVHLPRLKTGLPIRNGVARLVAFSYMCKAWTVKDWLAFADVFGMPLRLGKYGQNATDEEKATLLRAVGSIANDAAAIIPESMQIEFQAAAQSAGGPDMFLRLAEWLDKQVSKAVLGQTMTADDGASLSQAQVHNDVRLDIVESDAEQLANTLNRDLVRPFIDLNFGVQDEYPRLVFVTPKPEDLALLADNVAKLLPHGLKVGQRALRERLGIPHPDDDDELLGGQAIPGEVLEVNRVSLNRAQPSPPDYAEAAAATLGRAAEPAIVEWLDVVRAILDTAGSLPEAMAQIEAAYNDLDIGPMAGTLGEALAAANLAGRFEAGGDADGA